MHLPRRKGRLQKPRLTPEAQLMSVDKATVAKIASLARIGLSAVEAEAMVGELNGILAWVQQLGEVDVTGIEPMTAVIAGPGFGHLRLREDKVTDGGIRDAVLANAPAGQHGFFGVPKVIE